MRRQEAAYGWFSLMSLAWWCVALNQVATTTWPFASTDAWERANTVALLVYSVAYMLSMARFCERRLPRVEGGLWLLAAVGAAVVIWAPTESLSTVRNVLTLWAACVFFATCIVFLGFAWRHGRTDHRILSVCIAIFLVAAVHDLLSFLGILTDNAYYGADFAGPDDRYGAGAGMALRGQPASDRTVQRRVARQGFEAKAELVVNLGRQREYEVANARLNERLNLAHDLHDGLGGTLVSGIATLERSRMTSRQTKCCRCSGRCATTCASSSIRLPASSSASRRWRADRAAAPSPEPVAGEP
jgi:signal transduction histidine kinase